MSQILKILGFVAAVALVTALFMVQGGLYFIVIVPPVLTLGLLLLMVKQAAKDKGGVRYAIPFGASVMILLYWANSFIWDDPYGLVAFGTAFFYLALPLLGVFAVFALRKPKQEVRGT